MRRCFYKLSAIEMDHTIQCRASIDMATVNEYAERMLAKDEFPPVVLFGTRQKMWIGDGWHRIAAAQQVGSEDICADLRTGGRADALKFALGANAVHGHRRTNADKRRAVEIALREFPKLSSRAVAKLCGVSDKTVESVRDANCGNSAVAPRVGEDGRERRLPTPRREPTAREIAADLGCLARDAEPDDADDVEGQDEDLAVADAPWRGPHPDVLPKDQQRPRNGMQFARLAIRQLQNITNDDEERVEAFRTVKEWINGQA